MSTKEALEKLSKTRYDLIISDMDREHNETDGLHF